MTGAFVAWILWRCWGDVRAARRWVRALEEAHADGIRITLGMEVDEHGCLRFDLPRGWALAGRMLERGI